MTLKSTFISLYIVALLFALGHAALVLLGQPGNLAWWAVLVSVGAPLSFFVQVYLHPAARTSPVMWSLLVLSAAGVLALVAVHSHEWPPWIYTAGLGLGGSLAYQFWYSRFGRLPSPSLARGRPLPSLEFETPDGKPIRTGALPSALLLVFYRGNWCPLCMAQIREIAEQYRELAARGVRTLLISSQPPGHTEALAARFDVDFLFLIDRDNRVARQLGIVAENGTPLGLQALGYGSDTAMPTVILTNADKTIIFCDETDNYRVRPEPATFLALLDGTA